MWRAMEVADSLATAKPTSQSQRNELQAEDGLNDVGLYWEEERMENRDL